MARPKAVELTERELEVMQAFWKLGETTVSDVRDQLAHDGRDLAYTTVATLVRLITEKGYLEQTTVERPFLFRPVRTFEEVSSSLLGTLIEKVFGGSREALLLRLHEQGKLTASERAVLEQILVASRTSGRGTRPS